ncbi:hypothetical protein VTI28DRAFT_3430 [Corynascus sepedonium]
MRRLDPSSSQVVEPKHYWQSTPEIAKVQKDERKARSKIRTGTVTRELIFFGLCPTIGTETRYLLRCGSAAQKLSEFTCCDPTEPTRVRNIFGNTCALRTLALPSADPDISAFVRIPERRQFQRVSFRFDSEAPLMNWYVRQVRYFPYIQQVTDEFG